MMAMLMANATMGIYNFERNGVHTTNYPSQQPFTCESLISWRPIFGTALSDRKAKRIEFYSLCAPFYGKTNASWKPEQDKQLIGGGILDKEFEFRPSFDVYLKAMESAMADREKQPSLGSKQDSSSSAGEKDKGNVKFEKFRGNRHGEKHTVNDRSKLFQNDDTVRIINCSRRKGSKDGRKHNPRQGYQNNVFSGNARSSVQGEFNGLKSVNVKVKGNLLADTTHERHLEYQTKSQGQRVSFGMEFVHERNHIQHKNDIDWRIAPKTKTVSLEQDNLIKADRGTDMDMDMDRVAFKNFDVAGDCIDKPRIPRREMEDRIQKLANCLNGADIDMPVWLFSKIMRSAKIRYTDHSILRVIQLLGKLGNWIRVLQVIEWLQLRERFKSYRTRHIYTTALTVLGKARKPVESLNIFYAMQHQMDSYPDIVAYRCIAVTLGQAGHLKEIFDVIDFMRSPPPKKIKKGVHEKWDPRLEPDLVVYNALLNACVKRKQWEGAFWVLQQLRQQGLEPSRSTYGLFMEAMFVCGKYSLVHEFFKKLQKSSIPNALTYRVLVNTFWGEGKTNEALLAVEEMERRGIVGSAALYYDLARCLCSAGRCQEALMQVQKLCKVANKPLVVTYTGLIQACLAHGDIRNGAYIFHEMKKFCRPNLVTCNIMMKAYVEHRMFEEAKVLFRKMLANKNGSGIVSDDSITVMPDVYTYNTLLDAFSAEKNWVDFGYAYKQMLSRKFRFNAKRHLPLILDASRAGKVELLEATWNKLAQENQAVPLPLFKEHLCVKLGNRDYAAAISCITSQYDELQTSSKTAWLSFLNESIDRFGIDTLRGFMDRLTFIFSRDDPQNQVLRDLLDSCEEFFQGRCSRSLQLI